MKTLARFTRTRIGRLLVGRFIIPMISMLPLKHLRDTDTLLAFYHPRPSYPFHLVIIPKKAIPRLEEVDPADAFLPDLFYTVQSLVEEFDLGKCGYRLIVNGGAYQEFPHLHFHLVSNRKPCKSPGG